MEFFEPRINADAAGFWEGCREHTLRFQRCRCCGHVRWPAAYLCPECLSSDTEMTQLPPEGVLYSYVVMHKPFHPSVADKVPYVVATVDLQDGVRILTNLVDCDPATLRCGDKVIGKVTLVEDSSLTDKVQYGMLPWIVSSEEFDFTGLYSSVEVTVPKSYTVKLNGNALGSEYIIQDDIQFELLKDYYSSYPNLPVMVTYRFDHIIGELEPEIFDGSGNQIQIDESRGEEQFLNYCSGDELAKLTDFTVRFAERYQSYNAGIGGDPAAVYTNRLAGYIVPGSDLDFRMKAAQDGLGWAHTNSIDIHYTTLNSAVSFGGGVYLCDFSSAFTTTGINGTQDFENNIKMIVVDKTGNMSDLRVAEMSQYKKDAEESQ